MTELVHKAFFVETKFPTLNDLIRLAERSPWGYDRVKKRCESAVKRAIDKADMPAFKWAQVFYSFNEVNRRRDPSNVAAAAIKFIEDALVRASVLPGDGWTHIRGIHVEWQLLDVYSVGVVLKGEIFDEPRKRIYERRRKQEAAKAVERAKSTGARAVGFAKRPKPVGKAGRRPGGKGPGARLRQPRRKG